MGRSPKNNSQNVKIINVKFVYIIQESRYLLQSSQEYSMIDMVKWLYNTLCADYGALYGIYA